MLDGRKLLKSRTSKAPLTPLARRLNREKPPFDKKHIMVPFREGKIVAAQLSSRGWQPAATAQPYLGR
jgi:hypothetical protein